MILSAAKREKDFYLSKIEKSRAMTEIDARMEKVLTLSNIVNSEILFSYTEFRNTLSYMVDVCVSERYSL